MSTILFYYLKTEPWKTGAEVCHLNTQLICIQIPAVCRLKSLLMRLQSKNTCYVINFCLLWNSIYKTYKEVRQKFDLLYDLALFRHKNETFLSLFFRRKKLKSSSNTDLNHLIIICFPKKEKLRTTNWKISPSRDELDQWQRSGI